MFKLNKFLLLPLFFISPIIAAQMNFDINPYAGVNAQWRHLNWDPNFGGRVFNKNFPEGNIYAGLKFCDFLGLEAGYESTSRVSRSSSTPLTFLGVTLFNPPGSFVAKAQIKGWHMDVLGFLPIWEDCLSAFASIGIASLKVYHQVYQTADAFGALPDAAIANTRRVFSKHRNVLKLGIGLQQMITECVAVRFVYNWEQTSRFRNLTPNGFPTSILRVHMKDSQGLGLGVIIYF